MACQRLVPRQALWLIEEMSDSASADLQCSCFCRSVVEDPDVGVPAAHVQASVVGDQGVVGLFECRPTVQLFL
ncbi:hypothetical protein H663_010415 [Limnohabitans planktonicus II-D5]|uniref:Uncharacterized protein n=1 Tax=Limnohabitans planktonicus II-D5 TaxID=1293045 RepID=A0A2T7UDL2_9BURK|nr:hypothetical protein H663_010415 [Limnohabitans planktonicus II-D5]